MSLPCNSLITTQLRTTYLKPCTHFQHIGATLKHKLHLHFLNLHKDATVKSGTQHYADNLATTASFTANSF